MSAPEIIFKRKHRCGRPSDEAVGITIEVSGLKSQPQIAIWVAEELEPDIKHDAELRAGIVAALKDFLGRVAGVQ